MLFMQKYALFGVIAKKVPIFHCNIFKLFIGWGRGQFGYTLHYELYVNRKETINVVTRLIIANFILSKNMKVIWW